MFQQSLDALSLYVCPDTHCQIAVADVGDTARTLERNHLCGPIAGLVQAELLAVATLFAAWRDDPKETLTLRTVFPEGALEGALVECSPDFSLRGYTRKKLLPDLDSDVVTPNDALFARAVGNSASCTVLRAAPGGKPVHAHFDLSFEDNVTAADIAEHYLNDSLQLRALVDLSAASRDYVDFSRALLFELPPEASDKAYDALCDRFDRREVASFLDHAVSLEDLREFFRLPHLRLEKTYPVRFFCPCSSERVLAMLRALPREDLLQMAAKDEPANIYCHMCGKGYAIRPDQIQTLL